MKTRHLLAQLALGRGSTTNSGDPPQIFPGRGLGTQFWKHTVASLWSTEAPATQLYVVSLVVLPTMEDPVSSRLCTPTALMLIPCTLNTTSHFVKVVATAEGLPSSLWCTDGAITGVSWPGLCGPAGTSPWEGPGTCMPAPLRASRGRPCLTAMP